MLRVLADRTYRHLFLAQLVSLVGTGLATVALGLLAFALAGDAAGAVLGTALAIKMVAYVGVAPIAAAFAERLPRRAMLVTLDLVRAGIALALPFVTEIWQVYVLIFALQAASAGFTPTFQATIPDVLHDEADYTRALSLSRLAYDLESLASPLLAAALLLVVGFSDLFVGTVLGFAASAALVLSVTLPNPKPTKPRGVWDRTTRGARLYLATPRLRGLLALNLAVAAAGAMVFVNTVPLVRGAFGLGEAAVALALAAFGGGSMLAALVLPWLLERAPDRAPMLLGALVASGGMLLGPFASNLPQLTLLWLAVGIGYALAQTPSGRLLRRSAHPADRPALFAAQFALSHACWLVTYPLAGWAGAAIGLDAIFVAMAVLALAATAAARQLWPADDPAALPHRHADLPPEHPHLAGFPPDATGRHDHPFVIDDLHGQWPRHG
jgi:MFS family permease